MTGGIDFLENIYLGKSNSGGLHLCQIEPFYF